MSFYKGKNVLVAGGTGTIGIPLVKMLVHEGANVSVASMDNKHYASLVLPVEVKYIRTDLSIEHNCNNVTKDIDYVFDMVGLKGSTQINNLKLSNVMINFMLFQIHLMEEARRNKVKRFLLVGSICEYPQMSIPKKEDAVWDSLPKQNDMYVGMAKRIGELQAQSYLDEGSWDAVRIIRPSNVYGPYDDFNPNTAQVLGSLISQAVDNDVIKVVGDGSPIRDFVYSEDVAWWAMECLEKLEPCDAVNISSGKGTSIKRITEIIKNCIPPVEFKFNPGGYQGDNIRILSIEKARDKINYYERTPIEEGISKTIQWYKENKKLAKTKAKYYDNK